jgi:putative glutamine amidotransferase
MIKIGLTACIMYEDVTRPTFGQKILTYAENDMLKMAASQGAMPILLPNFSDARLKDYLDEMDGFILQGGVDLSPLSYGDALIENGRWPGDKNRDDYELRVLDYAFKNNKPIFGVCRGFQIINTYFKGKLYQDLELETNTTMKHRDAILYDQIHHGVTLEPDSLLKEVYKSDTIEVNTVHHQGIKVLGKGLVVEAYCPEDNLIEAIRFENTTDHFVWGVQWHPEFNFNLNGAVDSADPIMTKMMNEIKKRKK